eukprot:1144074-Pelagomonas_calceolata.AAC.1
MHWSSSTFLKERPFPALPNQPACYALAVQSHVSAHAELQWLLNCVTPIGWLNRMIQFKEKSRKQVGKVSG